MTLHLDVGSLTHRRIRSHRLQALATKLQATDSPQSAGRIVRQALDAVPTVTDDGLPRVIVDLVDRMTVPAYVRDSGYVVRHSNTTARGLSPVLWPGSNIALALFLDSAVRSLADDWSEMEARVARRLLHAQSAAPYDLRVRRTIDELLRTSAHFREAAAREPSIVPAAQWIGWRHPVCGSFRLRTTEVAIPGCDGLELVLYTTAESSVSAAAIELIRATPIAEPVRARAER